jgi:pyruvate dehydrogenase E2 component (dihydrolipoamide acetyltransferase)
MAQSFKLPDLGEGLTEGEIARWHVQVGDEVAEDDPLVDIQTDKATVEIPSPYAGTVLQILVAEGEVAPVGAVLVVVGAAGEEIAEVAPAPRDGRARGEDAAGPAAPAPGEAASGGRARATPLVRKIAASSASTWRRSLAPVRAGGSRRRTFAPRRALPSLRRRGAGSRSEACGASSPSTWPERTGRCPRSRGWRSATSEACPASGSSRPW